MAASTPVVGEQVDLAITQIFESVKHGCVDQVAQAFAPLVFKHGNHVHFPHDAFGQIPAPGACGSDRSGINGGEK